MNLLNSFNDFYDNLSSNGLFFFWIIVFLFVFLIFLLIVLYFKNKKLIKLLKDNRDTTINTISEEAPIENKEVPISNATFTVEDKILENDTTSLTDVNISPTSIFLKITPLPPEFAISLICELSSAFVASKSFSNFSTVVSSVSIISPTLDNILRLTS